jgi:lipopolysaccharide transport system permease protein
VEIVHTLAQRQFTGRYRGSLLGVLTAVLVPLCFLLGYTFVFSTLIPVRIRPEAARGDYAFFFFAGLVGWGLFSETLSRAPRLFSDQAHFVRKALFPVSALPVSATLTAFYHSLVWLVVFLVARFFTEGSLPATVALAPLLLVLLALLTAGMALAVAAFGAFVRDLSELIGPLLTIGLFVSPVLYPAERIASIAPWLVDLNPLAPLIESLRDALLGAMPALPTLAASLAWSLGVLIVGAFVHRRLRPALADVL